MKKIITYCAMPFLLLPIAAYIHSKPKMIDDLARYASDVPFPQGGIRYFCYCLLGKKEYRNVFAYRCGGNPLVKKLIMLFVPPLETIEILTTDIGEGMRLFHKSGCTINAHRIGKNFSCGQGVTIGIGKRNDANLNKPVIGDHVWVGANAVIIGGICVGDHVTIGAGSVLLNDVPDHCVVAGNPARIIKGPGKP